MCVYHFWANSVPGLKRETKVEAKDYAEALKLIQNKLRSKQNGKV